MGLTHVTDTIRNPVTPERAWEGLFLVDTGAVDCRVPRAALREIGIEVDPQPQRLKRLPAVRLKYRERISARGEDEVRHAGRSGQEQ